MIAAALYRYDTVNWAPPVDEFDNPIGAGRVSVELYVFPVVDYTPCGASINLYGERKFVNLRAVKQYACASIAEAKESFRRRKQRQISILSAQLRNAERALAILEGD